MQSTSSRIQWASGPCAIGLGARQMYVMVYPDTDHHTALLQAADTSKDHGPLPSSDGLRAFLSSSFMPSYAVNAIAIPGRTWRMQGSKHSQAPSSKSGKMSKGSAQPNNVQAVRRTCPADLPCQTMFMWEADLPSQTLSCGKAYPNVIKQEDGKSPEISTMKGMIQL